MKAIRTLLVFAALAACSSSTTSPTPAPPAGTVDGGTSGVDGGGPSSDAGTGSDAAAGTVIASQIDLYNRGDDSRQRPPLMGNYTLVFEDGGKLEGTLVAHDPRVATDNTKLKRDFRRVGEKVTITVPGLSRVCTVSAKAKELTYVSIHLQEDPTLGPGQAPANEIMCVCGFEENPGQPCSL